MIVILSRESFVISILALLGFNACNFSNRQEAISKITFSCKEIYVDTTRPDVNILFKINIANKSEDDFYFFSNPSDNDSGTVYSNFYLRDTVNNAKYQLLSGPVLNPLFSMKKFNLPILLIHSLTWQSLSRIFNKYRNDSISRFSLTIALLRRSRLILINDKRDFIAHHINYKFFIRDTVNINMPDSIPVYFLIPDIKLYINDSLFRQKNPKKYFLTKNSIHTNTKTIQYKLNNEKADTVYGIVEDTVLENKIFNEIFKLPEVQAKQKFIDSLTNHKSGVSIIILENPTKDAPYYCVQVGYNGRFRFEPYYTFYVYPRKKLEIKFLNTMNDSVMSLEEWRKNK